ncbi:hypothetical protein BKA69DRAFT_392572 [Paraphysoderma sedebokerense]|nr:hypothetical protein BKA69DRAFT_392572 [Paraphysoderma sedebokerense]
MTPERCYVACQEKDFNIAGLSNGTTCLCGSRFTATAQTTNCTVPCSGEPNLNCGGINKISVFQLSGSIASMSASSAVTSTRTSSNADVAVTIIASIGGFIGIVGIIFLMHRYRQGSPQSSKPASKPSTINRIDGPFKNPKAQQPKTVSFNKRVSVLSAPSLDLSESSRSGNQNKTDSFTTFTDEIPVYLVNDDRESMYSSATTVLSASSPASSTRNINSALTFSGEFTPNSSSDLSIPFRPVSELKIDFDKPLDTSSIKEPVPKLPAAVQPKTSSILKNKRYSSVMPSSKLSSVMTYNQLSESDESEREKMSDSKPEGADKFNRYDPEPSSPVLGSIKRDYEEPPVPMTFEYLDNRISGRASSAVSSGSLMPTFTLDESKTRESYISHITVNTTLDRSIVSSAFTKVEGEIRPYSTMSMAATELDRV